MKKDESEFYKPLADLGIEFTPKGGGKVEAIKDEKDNYEKKPSAKLKKKRSTSDGYMNR